ncbi:MAG: S8 family peptidase [Bacteroidia bacterium]|nr:S8 family peptidase [Bacteroidia bacterium]
MKTYTPILLILCLFSQMALGQGAHIRESIQLDQLLASQNLTGKGVLVVIIDRGIDYRHPDFIDSTGNTRIEYIYDMLDNSGANDPNNPFGVGTIFDKAAINQSLQTGGNPLTTDRGGHGTATTGIVAGNGSAAGNGIFQGVAPEAKIISIKVTHDPFPAFGNQSGQAGFFDPSFIPIALDFAQAKITELGIPSVTLMNLGSIGGPTDGTSLISRKIDEYVNAGNTFVCGVGDDGGADNYAEGNVASNQDVELLIRKGETGFLRLDLWYEEDDRFSVSIERPDGIIEGPFTAPSTSNASADRNLTGIFIGHRGADVEFFGATSNRRELLIDFTGDTGVYKVILNGAQISGSGIFQASLNPSTYFNDNRFLSFVVPGYSINDYTSASMAITPGDYVVKNTWIDIDGQQRGITGQGNPGEIWIGSSSGPTQDGRRGIDFVVPGEVCYAAYSPNSYYSSFRFNTLEGSNGFYGIQNAVSGAAPVATGIIALMLEANASLKPAVIKSILQQASLGDNFTGIIPNDTWGHGKLNARLAIESALTGVMIGPPLYESNIFVFPNPVREQLTIRLINDRINFLILYNMDGKKVFEKRVFREEIHKVRMDQLPEGIYLLKILGQKNQHLKKVIIRD